MPRKANLTEARNISGSLTCLLAAALTIAPLLSAPQQTQQPMPQATAAPALRVFGSNTGLMLNFVKADKTADFEAVMAKLKEALAKNGNPVRKQQAASWRVYRSPDSGPVGSVLYVYFVDPVVKGADYSVATILAEAFSGEELVALQKQYIEAYASGQNFVNLALVSDLGK